LTFAAEAGLTYWISLFEGPAAPEPLPTDEVNFELRLANSPPNDAFESPIHLSGAEVATNFSNVEGVQAVSDTFPWGPTVWFLWQPPSNGLYEISFPSTLCARELLLIGSSLTNLSPLWPKSIGDVFAVQGSASYYISVQACIEVGNLELRITPYPHRATNDDFAERIATSGSNVVFTGDFDGSMLYDIERFAVVAAVKRSESGEVTALDVSCLRSFCKKAIVVSVAPIYDVIG